MPTLTLTASGLTLTATVAGSGGGAVSVFAVAPDRPWDPPDWRAFGSRTGDGPVSAALPPGVWWLYATTGAGPTAPVPVVLAGPDEDSLPSRCRAAVAAVLRLNAATSPAGGVHEEPYPDQANKTGPWVSVSAAGLRERVNPGLNLTNDVGYPVRVLFCDKHHLRDMGRVRTRIDPFRLAMTDLFSNRRLAGVPESIQCEVEPLDTLDPRLPSYQSVASGVLVWCWTRRQR